MRVLWHSGVILVLTILSQIGGIAWAIALLFRGRRMVGFLLIFGAIYTALWIGVRFTAPAMGRVAVPCIDNGPTRARAQSPLFCVLNRTYVTPEMAQTLDTLAAHMHAQFPGTRTRILDAGFPFLGVPLLPHLSHDDGTKADLSFWYEGGNWRSPVGYWAFEQPRPTVANLCDSDGSSLRWGMSWLQPFMRDLALDETRTREALTWLNANLPDTGKIFVEPHLLDRLGLDGDKLRFQGCNAARHDDHIHIQL